MINPGLLLLPALALTSLWGRRRPAAVAAVLCGAAGLLLLAPALVIPDGVPSPAAIVAEHPPWQSTAVAAYGNPAQGDVAYQIYPWLLYQREELRAGRLPFWNPFQYSGTPFWSNGQGAPLFPLHLLFGLLPVQLGLVLLPWLRVLVAGLGAWALGRELGLSPTAALVPALVLPLSGMYVSFLLFPMANALALVPWVFWATERVAAGRSRWPLLAALIGLQLLAGHPETALHTALLSGLYLATRGASWLGWRRWALSWAVGAGAAAIQLLPMVSMLVQSSRWQTEVAAPEPAFAILLAQPLRLLLPDLYGNPALGTWWGPFNYLATAVYVGAVTLPLALCGARAAGADRRLRAVVWMSVFSAAAAYHLPLLRDLLGALPILGKAAQHRLIFGIELGLGLLAGAGLDRWRAGQRAGLGWGLALSAGALAAAWWRFGAEWAARQTLGGQLRGSLWVLACALGLWLSSRLDSGWRRRLAAALPALVAADLLIAHGRINPAQPLAALYPSTGAIEFLQSREGRVAGTGDALRPNTAMVYRLRDVRGDDSMKLGHYERLYAERLGEGHPTYYRPLRAWSEPWLDDLGLRWVLTGPAESAPVAGWPVVYQGADARVFERPGARPLVRFEQPAAGEEIRVLEEGPGRWRIGWRSLTPGRLVVAEAWDTGWRAELDGRAVPVAPAHGHLLGIDVGSGAGVLSLRYLPTGLGAGAALSFSALAALGLGLWWRR